MVSEAENYTNDKAEDYTFPKELEGVFIYDKVIKREKREARQKLITNFCMASVVKQEYVPDAPPI